MSTLICKKDFNHCRTPGMCSPHGGCQEAPFNPDWDRMEAAQESLREHMEIILQLKAENEALRKDAERANYWKQRAKSAEGHLWSSDIKAAAMALQARTEFAAEDWEELSGCQKAKLLSAAATVIGAVNDRRDLRKPGNDAGVIYG